MELVYLWVEEYKNIHKQGFNFSPKFTCDYDGKELTIKENDDYIENFFGENINVTAIVGKNGSGKSSVLELIQILLSTSEAKIEPLKKCKLFGIFYDKVSNKKYQKNYNVNIPLLDNINDYLKYLYNGNRYKYTENYPYTLSYNYSIDSSPYFLNEYYHRNDGYSTPLLLQPYKKDNIIDINSINYFANRDMYKFLVKDNIEFEHIKSFFQPITFQLFPNHKKITCKSSLDDFSNDFMLLKNKILEDDSLDKLYEKIKLIDMTYLYILKKIFKIAILGSLLDTKPSFFDKLFKKSSTVEIIFKDIKTVNNFDELKEKYIPKKISYSDIMKIEQSFKFIEFLRNKDDNFKLDPQKKYNFLDIEDKTLLLNIAPWIDVELYNRNNISFTLLSYGQKFLIRFIYSLLYQLQNLSDRRYKHINILLDEIEVGLHPQWQKDFLNLLFDVLQKYNTHIKSNFYFHIIFTTHSPFLLSDISKQNIIFIDNGIKVKGTEKKQTFGANIHTLLSDSFFMEDGLMGEFATGKIDEVIQLLNKEKLDEKELKYCEQIISIIGEPIVKNQLQRMLTNKKISYLAKDTREEIEFLKHRIDLLSKRL